MTSAIQRLVVICPVFNEETNVEYFFGRLAPVLSRLDPARYEYRLVFTNNRSTDGTLDKLRKLQQRYDWVDYLTSSRNHGYQLSVLAGLSSVDADLYMVCDVDCEDPPELLAVFLEKAQAGADVAYGIRNDRPDPWLVLKSRMLFYRILKKLGDFRIIPYMAEFALLRRSVRDHLVAGNNTYPFLRAEIGFIGFSFQGVPYRREPRRHGPSHYNFWANSRFAISGILSSTTFPLRGLFYALPGVFVLNTLGLLMYLLGSLGFEGAAILFLFLNGCFASAGVSCLGIYLARTYQNGLGRPRFIIDESLSSRRFRDEQRSGIARAA
jgi:glycosyltransferase involved in cell wall biosynthesis